MCESRRVGSRRGPGAGDARERQGETAGPWEGGAGCLPLRWAPVADSPGQDAPFQPGEPRAVHTRETGPGHTTALRKLCWSPVLGRNWLLAKCDSSCIFLFMFSPPEAFPSTFPVLSSSSRLVFLPSEEECSHSYLTLLCPRLPPALLQLLLFPVCQPLAHEDTSQASPLIC